MKIYSIYDPVTKIIIGHIRSNTASKEQLIEQHQYLIDGYYEINKYKIVNNQVVSVDPVINDDYVTLMKNIRNVLLSDVDRVNPIWYASLATDQQQELQAYRQALLAVPQQAGFPESVEWPRKPTWL
jgi:hypothetical protein